jgi:hypothetical protein
MCRWALLGRDVRHQPRLAPSPALLGSLHHRCSLAVSFEVRIAAQESLSGHDPWRRSGYPSAAIEDGRAVQHAR